MTATPTGLTIRDVLTIAVAVVALWAAFRGLVRFGGRVWTETFGSRLELARRLKPIRLGMATQYVDNILGVAVLRKHLDVGDIKYQVSRYVTRHAWVSLLISPGDTVCGISITTVDPRFRFECRVWSFNQVQARLGVTTFDQVPLTIRPESPPWPAIGAHSFRYSEAYYFGRPGLYKSYILSANDSGVKGTDWVPTVSRAEPGDDRLATVRSHAVVNTFSVVESSASVAEITSALELSQDEIGGITANIPRWLELLGWRSRVR